MTSGKLPSLMDNTSIQTSRRIENINGRQGTYALLVQVSPNPIQFNIGKLGRHRFPKGIYVYVGSAMGRGSTSLGHRLRRHFSCTKKKHWHIDYLLSDPGASALGAIWAETEKSVECKLASALRDRGSVFEAWVDGFGASDCREGCGTHLYRYVGSGDLKTVQAALSRVFRRSLGMPSAPYFMIV